MANQDVRVSALQSASTLSTEDLALATVVDELSETGYTSKKITEGAKASQYLEAFTFANLNTTAKTIVGAINEAATTGGAEIDDTATDTSTAWSSSRIVGLLPTDTASGAVANFPDGADNVPVDSLVVNIEPVQAGTGDPSPSNVRPISGWSAVNVTRAGKNLFNKSNFITSYSSYYELADDGSIKTIGNLQNNNVLWDNVSKYSGVVSVIFKYKYMNSTGSAGLRAKIEYTDGTTAIIYTAVSADYNTVIATSNSSKIVRKITTDYDTLSNTTNFYFQVELGTAATTYEPYTGNSVTISLGQTVYGGELDVKNGVLRVTRASVVLDENSGNWQFQDQFQQGYLSDVLQAVPAKYNYYAISHLCDKLKPVSNYTRGANLGNFSALVNSGLGVGLSCAAESLEDFIIWITNNPVTFVYELATPVEVTLTPEQINTLKGVNNIWADTGDTAVEYRADIQKYIEKKIAEAVGGNRSLSLMKSTPEETKEETKQEGDEDVNR